LKLAAIVIVVAEPVAVAVAPIKLILVIPVPTDVPALLISTPLITPVKFVPEPKNDVALTTPTTFNFAVGIVLPTPTLLLASVVIEFINLDRSRARVIIPFLFIYL